MSGQPRVLARGAGWIAVDKPPGVAVIPGRGEPATPPLRAQLEAALGQQVWVVHRLDRDTSGVLVFALDAPTHRALSMAFEEGRVRKRYLALVTGALREPVDLEEALVPARRGRMRPARPGEQGKPARTRFRPVESFGEAATLVEAEPLTGRTHQIRVHLRSAGHPLLFDHQYGSAEPVTAARLGGTGTEVLLARTPLHAWRLRLPAPSSGGAPIELEAPLPADLEAVLEALRGGAR